MTSDFLVIGAGSAGCVLAAELTRREAGTVRVLEAGPSERHPLVTMPFGLVWLIGSRRRDWRFASVPMDGLNGRSISIPRGRMVGGSGSINSMVWFRGRAADFNAWRVPGWSYAEVVPAFEAVEEKLRPTRMSGAHPLTEALGRMLPSNSDVPNPDVESAGVFAYNRVNGRRNSAADAFLRPSGVEVITGAHVDRVLWDGDRAIGVVLVDGSEFRAGKGVVLSAGSIASPSILMRSGIGPDTLGKLGIDVRYCNDAVGENLHDHPSIGLHFQGAGTGYGLEPAQWPAWALAPVQWAFTRTGRLASPTVEGGAFFNARGDAAEPDVQSHFIPFHLSAGGGRYALKSGYFADVCLCRPKSRGGLSLSSRDARAAPQIDLGLLNDPRDLDTMAEGILRLRDLLGRAAFGERRGTEVSPGEEVTGDDLKAHIRTKAATAYHPVGTCSLGPVVTPRLEVAGTRGLWVADASVMPAITSANTNAPSMMIGWKGAEFISKDAA